ncbi:MAG: type 1 glutamine amidotransferase domain-containing protein, partial [Bacteroidota bacterium]
MKKHILIIAANPSTSTTTGWPVGYWLSEVTHPYEVFTQAGYAVSIASPKGGKIEMDAMSNPHDESGRSAWDEVSKRYLQDDQFLALLEQTPEIGRA